MMKEEGAGEMGRITGAIEEASEVRASGGYLERLELPEFQHDIVLPVVKEEEGRGIPEIYVDSAARRRLYVEVLTRKIGPEEFAELVEQWVEKAIAQKGEVRDSWKGISELVKLVLAYTAGAPAKVIQKSEGDGYGKIMELLGEAKAEERVKEYGSGSMALAGVRGRVVDLSEEEVREIEAVGDDEIARAWSLYKGWKDKVEGGEGNE